MTVRGPARRVRRIARDAEAGDHGIRPPRRVAGEVDEPGLVPFGEQPADDPGAGAGGTDQDDFHRPVN